MLSGDPWLQVDLQQQQQQQQQQPQYSHEAHGNDRDTGATVAETSPEQSASSTQQQQYDAVDGDTVLDDQPSVHEQTSSETTASASATRTMRQAAGHAITRTVRSAANGLADAVKHAITLPLRSMSHAAEDSVNAMRVLRIVKERSYPLPSKARVPYLVTAEVIQTNIRSVLLPKYMTSSSN